MPLHPGTPSSQEKIEARPHAGVSNTFVFEFSIERVPVGTAEFVTGKTIPRGAVNYQ